MAMRADPQPNPDSYKHVAPLFPIDAVDPTMSSRTGAIGPAPNGSRAPYALEYYKQLVPNAEVTLPGSTCATCTPHDAVARQYVDAAESRAARRAARRCDRGDALAVGHHGSPHDSHPQGARQARSGEGSDHGRGRLLAAKQRADRRRLRLDSLSRDQGRLHGHQRSSVRRRWTRSTSAVPRSRAPPRPST